MVFQQSVRFWGIGFLQRSLLGTSFGAQSLQLNFCTPLARGRNANHPIPCRSSKYSDDILEAAAIDRASAKQTFWEG